MFDDTITLTLTMTLLISLTLGVIGLIAFMWGLRTGQFDDEEKFRTGALFDGEDELRAAKEREDRNKAAANEAKEKASKSLP